MPEWGFNALRDDGFQGITRSVMSMDSCLNDFAVGTKDMDDEVASSNLGRNYAKAPFGMMRVVNVAVVALIVIAELMAIY